ncbi:DUF445 domain-containing protein [Moraxella sp. VT-16-12]|uniref:DUF445 domain-containing protein n=1 Tax=Moraxella sp. VT-16-12 TaxID=2014877 RepID=UPI000B7E898E|nr:hypothetical protein [Moraxella sp. VT-16-12]TWV81614.1 hypothetical protein CEW93_007820 [Moraxella sp. VT-16-12]
MFASLWQLLSQHPEFIAMLTIPPVTAFVTWAHVWMALEMLFRPIKFWGIGIKNMPWGLQGLGWQGIVPAKAGKISGVIVDQTLSKLGSLDEFFRAMEPEEMAEFITATVDKNLESLIDEIMLERYYVLWSKLPYAIKRRIYAHAHDELPHIMKALVLDLTYHVEDLVDMRQMIVRRMENDRKLMVDMFLKVGKKEIKFIWKISAIIGFGFGIIQMGIFYFVPQHWTVPFFAAIWGALTNWIAIWMVFNPVEPRPVWFLRLFRYEHGRIVLMFPHIHRYLWQGGFMKRQDEVSTVFANIVVKELVTLENVMHEMMYGTRADKTRELMKSHLYEMLESPVVATTLKMGMGDSLDEFKDTIIDKSIDATMVPIRDPELNTSRASKIFGLFESRIRALTPHEFQNLLRPAFKEDEMTLVVLGAITGLLAGWLHLVVVFF